MIEPPSHETTGPGPMNGKPTGQVHKNHKFKDSITKKHNYYNEKSDLNRLKNTYKIPKWVIFKDAFMNRI